VEIKKNDVGDPPKLNSNVGVIQTGAYRGQFKKVRFNGAMTFSIITLNK
jgi:hypothetical protein